ncbi:MAG: prepilin-type N-terminal cleavage/methylation domain-containing protein [Planctomycetes bacterium]|nr:prepilin-type N-terminal cleavage/methylation domain-containing protein [Planctomycetota bacterium]
MIIGTSKKRGFTMLELLAGLALLAVAMVLVIQIAQWSMLERGRALVRQAALETAANILESARAMSWEDITEEWAAQPRRAAPDSSLPPEAKLLVHVDAFKNAPATKRVVVQVAFPTQPGPPYSVVELTGLFSARTATAKEATP